MNNAITEKQRATLSLATSLISMGLHMVINFILSPYIVENFGEEANGFAQLASSFVNYATLLTVALNSMASRFITVSYYQQDYKTCGKYYSSVLIGNVFIILFLLFPSTFFVLSLERNLNIVTANVMHVKLLFAFVFLNFFVSLIQSVFGIAFYVKNALFIQNTVTSLYYVINALGLFIVFSLFTPSIYFISMVALVCALFTTLCYAILKRKLMPDIVFSIKSFDIKAVGEMISSGVWNTINQCGNLLMNGFDLLLANILIDPIQMGVLSVAKTLPNTIIQLGTVVNTSFSPNLTIAYASGKKNEVLSSLRFSMKCSSFLMSIPLMVLVIFGLPFYSLWVPSMNAKQLSVLSILTCMTFIPFSGPQTLYNVYTTTNKLKLNSATVILGGILNIGAVLVLLKFTNLGVYAVAGVSSCISILRNLLITVPYTAKLLGLKWYTFYKDVSISLLCCACVALVCVAVRYIMPTNSWLMLFIAVVVSCIISAASLFLILLNKQEKHLIITKFKKI